MNIRERREQVARMTPSNESNNSVRIRALVVALLDEALERDDADEAALHEMVDQAMDARLNGRAWLPARVEHVEAGTLTEAIEASKPQPEPAPVAEISPRTGKPKRKYTRRKKPRKATK